MKRTEKISLLLTAVLLLAAAVCFILDAPQPALTVRALPTAAQSAPEEQRLDINTAAAGQLELLPGIGPVLSERIVEYRETNGPFANTEELLAVEGIGEATLDKFRDYICAGKETP